jgi:hypothetical protein
VLPAVSIPTSIKENQVTSKKRIIGAGITVLVLAAVGLVYAAWTSSGTGSGYAKAGTAQALSTVDVSASTTATLYPGADGDVLIEIDNPNPYPVRVTSITGNGAITADAAHPGCTTTGVTFTDQTGQTIDVAANESTQTTLSGAASMSNASDNACQGAVFTIPVAFSGNSNG